MTTFVTLLSDKTKNSSPLHTSSYVFFVTQVLIITIGNTQKSFTTIVFSYHTSK